MNKTTIKIIAAGLIGLIVGFVGTLIVTGGMENRFSDRMNDMRDKGEHIMYDGTEMKGEMDGMMMGLEGKKGDEFDKAFLEQMIIHHDGAVRMAEEALKNAKHQEIKDLSSAIISAQKKEIDQMKKWESEWYSQQ